MHNRSHKRSELRAPVSRAGRRPQAARRGLAVTLLLALVGSAFPAASPARGENGVMSRGGVLKGKYHHLRFIIPFRGDFSQYDKVEIVRLGSDLGPDTVPPEKMEKYTEWLQQLFVNTGLFDEVGIVEEAELGPTPPAPATTLPPGHAASPAASEEQELALLPRSTPLLLARLDRKQVSVGFPPTPPACPCRR